LLTFFLFLLLELPRTEEEDSGGPVFTILISSFLKEVEVSSFLFEPFFLFLSSLIASGANRPVIGFSFSDNAAMGTSQAEHEEWENSGNNAREEEEDIQ